LYLLLIVFATLLWLVLLIKSKKEWVCTKCGDREILGRHKFCTECGGIMHAVKKEKILCPRGHRAEKHDRFCRKCGGFI